MLGSQQQCNSKSVLLSQRHNLQKMRQALAHSCREIARRSAIVAEEYHDPDLKFTHQAVSKWFRGLSLPSQKARELLAIVFKVPREEIDHCCGIVSEHGALPSAPVTIHVTDTLGVHHDYHTGVRVDFDFSHPHVFRDWTQVLIRRAGTLNRHFKSVSDRLCGYTPVSIAPYINRPGAVVILETGHRAFDRLESPEKHLWFAYLPDGTLEVCFLFVDEQGRHAFVARPGEAPSKWRRYRREQIDRVGYLGNRILFYLDIPQPNTANEALMPSPLAPLMFDRRFAGR